jgi:hypothetical protein
MSDEQKDLTQNSDADQADAKTAKADKADKAEKKPTILQEKYVTVKSKVSGRKFVGAGWLTLVKDKEIQVTADQKRCLLEAGAIYL